MSQRMGALLESLYWTMRFLLCDLSLCCSYTAVAVSTYPNPSCVWYKIMQSCSYDATVTFSPLYSMRVIGWYSVLLYPKNEAEGRDFARKFASIVIQNLWRYPVWHNPMVYGYCRIMPRVDFRCGDLSCQFKEAVCYNNDMIIYNHSPKQRS